MDKNTPVSAIMTREVIVADLETKFTSIQTLFTSYPVYHLPVVENDILIGIISIKDSLNVYSQKANSLASATDEEINSKFKVEDIMTKKPTTVSQDTTIGEAVEILANAKFRSLPVTDENGKIVGILSNKDFIKVFNLWLNPKDDDKVYSSGGAGVAI